jgi:class 3 adenylate cyclase
MRKSSEISQDIQNTIDTQWKKRNGNKIPATGEITLAGGAVEIDATFLYADLANSSKMVKELDRRVAAKILKTFLSAVSKLVKHNNGKIVSFDGDRVMGVFYGEYKNTSAVKCTLQINYIVSQLIRPKFESKYPTVKNATFNITHGVGVDTGTVLAVRGGVRGDNDTIWIDRAPNLAAKLSDIRELYYPSFITSRVYNSIHDTSKFGGLNNQNMWEERVWTFLDEKISVYRSSWNWEP